MSWAVFFDRDGVLTDAPVVDGRPGTPLRVADLALLPDAERAVARVRRLGARVFVVTNQPDVARGSLDEAELRAMHAQLQNRLPVDEIRVCPHDNRDGCQCRKPAPGMLVDLGRAWNLDLASSWMVGDRWVDIAAGAAAGVRTILVERPYSWEATSAGSPSPDLVADHRVADVGAASRLIARMRGSEGDVP